MHNFPLLLFFDKILSTFELFCASSILVVKKDANPVTLLTISALSDFQPPEPSKETLDCTEGGGERLGEGHVGDLMIFFSNLTVFVSSKPQSSLFRLIGEGVLTDDIEKFEEISELPKFAPMPKS